MVNRGRALGRHEIALRVFARQGKPGQITLQFKHQSLILIVAKPMKRAVFVRMIEQAGWVFDPASKRAGHDQYVKGAKKFAVPRHTEISAAVVAKWEKANEGGRP